jgi:hypothetical protein
MSRLVFNQTAVTPTQPSVTKALLWLTQDSILSLEEENGQYGVVPNMQYTVANADFTGTNVNTAQAVFPGAQDSFNLITGNAFMFEGNYHIHTTGTTSHLLNILFGGTATYTIGYSAWATNAATEVLGAVSAIWANVATAIGVSAALASATHHSVLLKGIVRCTGSGTFIPQYQWSAAPGVAGVTLANSYFWMFPIGPDTAQTFGKVN